MADAMTILKELYEKHPGVFIVKVENGYLLQTDTDIVFVAKGKTELIRLTLKLLED